MTSASLWVQGARPRTLGAAVAPVLVGTSAAVADADGVIWWRFAVLAMVVALALQVGVNYANDYSDGVRGTDKERKGPVRLTATGLATPRRGEARPRSCSFGVAAVAGLVLSLVVEPVAAARRRGRHRRRVCSTPADPKPYGYLGLGEVMVLVFFGFVATVGSAYVQVKYVPGAAWWGSLVVGLLACAILARQQRARRPDRRGHREAHARGPGRRADRRGALFVACYVGSFARRGRSSASRSRGRCSACSRCRSRWRRCAPSSPAADPPSLVPALVATSKVEVVVAVLVSVGLCLS